MAYQHITLTDEIIKELIMGDKSKALKEIQEIVLNELLNKEAEESVGASLYERTENRKVYRNGYRTRQYTTRIGTLDLKIPKLRNGTFSTSLFKKYERSEQALMLGMMEMVIQGVSTRKVTEVTEILCGTAYSKSTVSLLCQRLDPVIKAFRNRTLKKHYPFVIVDAIYMKARVAKAVRSRGLLIAIGVSEDGVREVLGFESGDGESYEGWSSFFGRLKERGLANVDLVVSDNHKGLVKAIRESFCGSLWQRCQTHFSRNFLDKIPKKFRSTAKVKLKDIYNSPSLEEAEQRKDHLMQYLEKISTRAINLLDEGFSSITAVFNIPEEYRRRLRTSNTIERLNEELRRRERVIRIFPNDDSLERIMGAVLMEQNEQWMSRKYMNMDCYLDSKMVELKMIEEAEKGINIQIA